MNVDEKENSNNSYFQDDETRYENDGIDTIPADHSISNTPDPDYGNEFDEEEFDAESALNLEEEDEENDDDDETDEDYPIGTS